MRSFSALLFPRAAHSGFTATDPQEGFPQFYHIETPTGTREFRYGGRGTNPIHQRPDPVIYVNGSGQQLAGPEVRNLNRSYPGDPNGYLTERLAFAIVEMIRQEEIDLSIDLHEASPEYPVINAMVAHENAVDLAVEAGMLLEVFSTYNPDRAIAVDNLPTLSEVLLNGLGAFLAPPAR